MSTIEPNYTYKRGIGWFVGEDFATVEVLCNSGLKVRLEARKPEPHEWCNYVYKTDAGQYYDNINQVVNVKALADWASRGLSLIDNGNGLIGGVRGDSIDSITKNSPRGYEPVFFTIVILDDNAQR
jgi:hypothetical protein